MGVIGRGGAKTKTKSISYHTDSVRLLRFNNIAKKICMIAQLVVLFYTKTTRCNALVCIAYYL